jgi:hypothetical protein
VGRFRLVEVDAKVNFMEVHYRKGKFVISSGSVSLDIERKLVQWRSVVISI